MGARRPDRNSSDVSADGARDEPGKTKAVVCTPRFIWEKVRGVAYKRRATGEGSTFGEQKKARVSYSTCGVMVAASYLKAHMARSHCICVPQTRGVDEVGRGPTKYVVSFPKVLQEVRCLVPGFPAVAHSAGRVCEHFMFRHFRSKVAVVQEGKETLPCCDMCGMHMPAGWLIRHRRTARCDRNTQMRWRQQDVEIAVNCSEATFSFIGEDEAERIEGVGRFKYLGRLLDRSDND